MKTQKYKEFPPVWFKLIKIEKEFLTLLGYKMPKSIQDMLFPLNIGFHFSCVNS